MLYLLLRKSARQTTDGFLARRGITVPDIVEPIFYEDLYRRTELRPGSLVFMDMDRINRSGYRALESLYDQLHMFPKSMRIINHPTKLLSRYNLLKNLHSLGINDYQIRKASEDLTGLSFPVYLRSARGHNLILSGLLENPVALKQTIREKRVWGNALQEIYVIEFCDTRDEHGVFTKYSAFKIEDKILPRHINFDTNWIVKATSRSMDQDLHMALQDQVAWFHETNPHQEWLERVCQIANLEYGRLDYSVLNGKPQLWEINTNPSFGARRRRRLATPYKLFVEPYRLAFYDEYLPALRRMAAEPDGAPPIPLQKSRVHLIELTKHLTAPQNMLWKIAYSKKPWVNGFRKLILYVYSILIRMGAAIRLIR